MMLSEIEVDAITEVINIGAGRAASALSELTGSHIELNVPKVHIRGTSDFDELAKTLDLQFGTTIQQEFEGDVSGRGLLAFPAGNAVDLARFVGDIDATDSELDEEIYGVLEEIGNIVLNAVLGSIANLFNCGLSYTLPQICTKKTFTSIVQTQADLSNSNAVALVADTSITVASRQVSGSLLLLFETGDLRALLAALTA